MGLLVQLEFLVGPVQMVSRDPLDLEDHLVLLEDLEGQVELAILDLKATEDLLDLLVVQDLVVRLFDKICCRKIT